MSMMKPPFTDVSNPPIVKEVTNEAEARRCWPAFSELRPLLLDENEFIERWAKQSGENYQIVYVEFAGEVVAVAGFRLMNTMAWGKIIYLDDLVALNAHRGRGFGSALLKWLEQKAILERCDQVHLDTGYQRHAAHKAYLRAGFQLSCHHLSLVIPKLV
jgi:GNAT superfamily N-acetyltransferase